MNKFALLDCTLRDGGYYTNWDFHSDTVKTYLNSFNSLPVEYLEVGYRNPQSDGYYGEYYFCPPETLQFLKDESDKKLAIILNEKDVRVEMIDALLDPCQGIVTMVRMAIDPVNFNRALELAEVIKDKGFEVAFNVMYMSTWDNHPEMMDSLHCLDGTVDYLYLVDSFGGVFPNDVKSIIKRVRSRTKVKIGFHGHNNLELALANTLAAIEEGVDIVDATITGMGRGAGNLKTELLLTILDVDGSLDYDALSEVTAVFKQLQEQHKWGTSLPYMVSGSKSLPQKQVMEWVSQDLFSFNTIIRAIRNQAKGILDNHQKLPLFTKPLQDDMSCIIVGGGSSVIDHSEAIKSFLNKNPKSLIIHASSKNSMIFENSDLNQIFCLVGNEGYRIESILSNKGFVGKAVLPPYPRKMGTYIPQIVLERAFELDSMGSFQDFSDSHTAIALRVAEIFRSNKIYLLGYDGYSENKIGEKEMNLFNENEYLFSVWSKRYDCKISSLTKTKYSQVNHDTIYSKIS